MSVTFRVSKLNALTRVSEYVETLEILCFPKWSWFWLLLSLDFIQCTSSPVCSISDPCKAFLIIIFIPYNASSLNIHSLSLLSIQSNVNHLIVLNWKVFIPPRFSSCSNPSPIIEYKSLQSRSQDIRAQRTQNEEAADPPSSRHLLNTN